jgi:hypothetical protein
MLGIVRALTSPVSLGAIAGAIIAVWPAYQLGERAGYKSGVSDQRHAQAIADAALSAETLERIKNALSQADLIDDDTDLDALLRGLAGQAK